MGMTKIEEGQICDNITSNNLKILSHTTSNDFKPRLNTTNLSKSYFYSLNFKRKNITDWFLNR